MATVEEQLAEALARIATLETAFELQTKVVARHEENIKVIMDVMNRHQHSYSDSSFLGIPTTSMTGSSSLSLYDKNAAPAAKVAEDASDKERDSTG